MAYKWNKKRQRYLVTLRQGRDPVTGEPKRFYKSVRTKEEAEALDHQVRGHKLQNITIPSSKTTLKDYIEGSFLPGYCQLKIRERTRQGYESIIKSHLMPALGYMRLVDITTERLDRFYAGLLQTGLSKTTVNHIHALLRLILGQARKNKYLIVNPAIDASAPGIERAEIQSFGVLLSRQTRPARTLYTVKNSYAIFTRSIFKATNRLIAGLVAVSIRAERTPGNRGGRSEVAVSGINGRGRAGEISPGIPKTNLRGAVACTT